MNGRLIIILASFLCTLALLSPAPLPSRSGEEVDKPAAPQSNLASKQNKNQGGPSNGHISQRPDTLPGCLWTIVGVWQPCVNFWKARQVFTTWSLLRSNSEAHGAGLIPERQHPLQQPTFKGWVVPYTHLCYRQLPTREWVLGMPLLSTAFISVVQRRCFGGLQR